MSKPMNAYTGFAKVYETFMDNIPYDVWTEYLTGLLIEYGIEKEKLNGLKRSICTSFFLGIFFLFNKNQH